MDLRRWLIYFGIFLVAAGAIINIWPGSVRWFGKLPGDLRIVRGRASFFIPLTSTVIIAVVITLGIKLLTIAFPPTY